ncbi:MAG TPA: hypothetical protein VF523_10020 [Burkholderiales bacterium]|uniref:hypothetical protein n=1 Tax=Sphingobium sp. TaxID=1912891 RepID=UPI002ED04817
MELGKGYRVAPEVCPLGDAADRVDLVIETSRYIIAIEVKIRPGWARISLSDIPVRYRGARNSKS